MTTLDPNTNLTLRPDVVVTALEREAVLLDLKTKYFYSVNASGWAITQLFEGGASPAHAMEKAASWGARNGDLDAASRFISRLVEEGLIHPGGTPLPSSEEEFTSPWSAPTIEKHKEPLQKIMVSAFDPTLPLAE
jgi:hypothetical protein